MKYSIIMVIVVATILLVTFSTSALAQSSDPGAVGHQGDSPIGKKIAAGDYDPSEEPGHLGCTSRFASGDQTNNPHCPDDPGDDDEDGGDGNGDGN
jgi:hypothetical protein